MRSPDVVRETPRERDTFTLRRDIPALHFARVGWLERWLDWWHGLWG